MSLEAELHGAGWSLYQIGTEWHRVLTRGGVYLWRLREVILKGFTRVPSCALTLDAAAGWPAGGWRSAAALVN